MKTARRGRRTHRNVRGKTRRDKKAPKTANGVWPVDVAPDVSEWPESPRETSGDVCGEPTGVPGEPVRH